MWMSLADMRDGHGVDAAVDASAAMSAMTARFQARIEVSRPELDDLLDRLLLVAAHGGDADLDLVDADLVEQLGDADLLVVGEDDAGGLLAVAQRGVVDAHGRLGRPGPGDDETGEVAGHGTYLSTRCRSRPPGRRRGSGGTEPSDAARGAASSRIVHRRRGQASSLSRRAPCAAAR